MTSKELCARLSIERKQLNRYLRKGLPSTKDAAGRLVFDAEEVAAWLTAQGLARSKAPPEAAAATPPPALPLAKSIAEVANHFGVNRRTVFEWKTEGMPVGTHGYDLAAIAAWLEAKHEAAREGGDPERNELQTELLRIKVKQAQLDFAAVQQDLVHASDVARAIETMVNEIKAHLGELPGLFAADLPPDCSDELRRTVRQRTEERLRQVYHALSELAAARATDNQSPHG
jgi:phage terminase Nu1 subunit (DNA packaging protein)